MAPRTRASLAPRVRFSKAMRTVHGPPVLKTRSEEDLHTQYPSDERFIKTVLEKVSATETAPAAEMALSEVCKLSTSSSDDEDGTSENEAEL